MGYSQYEWTDEKNDTLRTLAATHTANAIGRIMGCHRRTVDRQLKALGITAQQRFQWTRERLARLSAMRQMGAPFDEIAVELGCTAMGAEYMTHRKKYMVPLAKSRPLPNYGRMIELRAKIACLKRFQNVNHLQ